MDETTRTEAELIGHLNDLLQLDHDAVQAYSIAHAALTSETLRATVEQFRGDHERHVTELTQLIRSRGATPVELPHLPSGAFKLAVQAAGSAAGRMGGGDVAVLLAFKANERQVRDKYRRIAREPHPSDVTSVLARAADDEARHYAWALEMLDELGAGADSAAGRVERVVEVAHARMADTMENVEREAMSAAGRATRSVGHALRENPVGAVLGAVGAGVVLAALMATGRRGR
jgi:rubrerythrin